MEGHPHVSDIVITGLGLVTPFGRGVRPYWNGLLEGRSVLAPAPDFGAPSYRGEPVGRVPRADEASPRTPGAARTPRKSGYARVATAEALRAAGLSAVPRDALVVLAGQAPAYPAHQPSDATGEASQAGAVTADLDEFVGPGPVETIGPDLARDRVVHLSHACATAAFAVDFARAALRAGLAPVAVVAGSSVLNRYEYASMSVVRAVSPAAARPFDVGRAGVSIGEGAGAVVLETARHARARGRAADLVVAGAACRVAGGKAASDTGLITACMRDALDDAAVDRVDLVHAHATGTVQGDAAELAALEAVAGGRDPLPVSSHKGAIGHLLHASGVPALAAAALSLRTGIVPPTPGLGTPEHTDRVLLPTAPLSVPTARVAAVNSFGFGGNNATLVLRHN